MIEIKPGWAASSQREAFDRSFEELPLAANLAKTALLAVTIAGDPFFLRVPEIHGLARERLITPLPGSVAGFLGLVGWKGALIPVWDLGHALGYAKAARTPWLALSAGEPRWACAFEGLDGYRQLDAGDLIPTPEHGPLALFSAESAMISGGLRPVLDLGLILKNIQEKNPSMLTRNPS